MKKDGIQTRNRKVTAKSKKRRGGELSSMDFFKTFDKPPFSTFAGATPSGFPHPSMTSYMNSAGYPSHHNPSADLSCRLGTSYPGAMTSSSFSAPGLSHSFGSSFYGASGAGGLDLTNSGIVAGAMAWQWTYSSFPPAPPPRSCFLRPPPPPPYPCSPLPTF